MWFREWGKWFYMFYLLNKKESQIRFKLKINVLQSTYIDCSLGRIKDASTSNFPHKSHFITFVTRACYWGLATCFAVSSLHVQLIKIQFPSAACQQMFSYRTRPLTTATPSFYSPKWAYCPFMGRLDLNVGCVTWQAWYLLPFPAVPYCSHSLSGVENRAEHKKRRTWQKGQMNGFLLFLCGRNINTCVAGKNSELRFFTWDHESGHKQRSECYTTEWGGFKRKAQALVLFSGEFIWCFL